MKPRSAAVLAAAFVLLLVGAAPAQAQPVSGRTDSGAAYAMGGVSVDDLRELERHKDRYTLWITTAARGSGAYLADVQVRITDARGALLFNQPIPGPWLFIDLPPGRYTVEAAHQGKPQRRPVQIARSDLRQVVFYFDSAAQVSPEWEKPFK